MHGELLVVCAGKQTEVRLGTITKKNVAVTCKEVRPASWVSKEDQ